MSSSKSVKIEMAEDAFFDGEHITGLELGAMVGVTEYINRGNSGANKYSLRAASDWESGVIPPGGKTAYHFNGKTSIFHGPAKITKITNARVYFEYV